MGCQHNWFPGYSRKTTKILCDFYDPFYEFVHYPLIDYGFYLSLICFFVNIFHVVILLHKSLRTAPTFIILTAVAVADLIMLTYAIEGEIILFYQNLHLCYSQTTDYWFMMARWITEYIRNYARRCSTWFSLSITILRAVVIRYPMSSTINKLSRPGAAFIIIGCIIATIIPINFIDVLRLSVNLIEENYVCEEFGYYERYYMVGRSTMFETHFELVQVWYKIIDGITSKMIPCILFPLSTFFLVWELRKTENRRQNLGTTSTSTSNSSRSTSNLVLAQTIAFFTAELPLGIIFLFQSLFDEFDYYGIYEYLILFELFFSFIQSGTTMTHMIICVLMSTQYRMNALMVIRCGYPVKPKPKNVVIFLTASSHV